MADTFAPAATRSPPRSSSQPDGDPSLQCLLSLMLGGSPEAIEDPAEAAARLPPLSQAFIRDLASAFGGRVRTPESIEAAPLDPSANMMLGWREDHADTGDAFADRLMAAFHSGALEIKPSALIERPVQTQVAEHASPSERKRVTSRGPMTLRSDWQHQKYPTPGVIGRPLYSPW